MHQIRSALAAVAIFAVAAAGTALAQAPAPSTPAPSSPPAASAPSSASSAAEDVSKWTRKQWAAARAKWAKEKEKWGDCRKQAKDQNLTGRVRATEGRSFSTGKKLPLHQVMQGSRMRVLALLDTRVRFRRK